MWMSPRHHRGSGSPVPARLVVVDATVEVQPALGFDHGAEPLASNVD